MTFASRRHAAVLASAIAAAALALPARHAVAQPTPPRSSDQAGQPSEPPPSTAPAPVAATESQITGQPGVTTSGLLGPIERLPATGYPTYPIRGIYGGSLWRVFHGLQWPYYPKTGIAVSGYGWIDNAYAHVTTTEPSVVGEKTMIQKGRILLRVTPTWTNGAYFVQAQAELVANKDQSQSYPNTVNADDVWLRVGQWNSWDVTVGRYEAWEVYHRGLGLEDVNSIEFVGASLQSNAAPQIYGVTDAFFRQAGVGQAAIHYYATGNLRFEIGAHYGSQAQNTVAVRPVGIFDLGWFKAKAGAEYVALTDVSDEGKGHANRRGFGGSLQFVVDPWIDFGVSGAARLADVWSSRDGAYDFDNSDTIYSGGGFLNARLGVPDLILGAGYDYTYRENQHFDSSLNRNGKFRHQQGFAALQYYLWRQIFIKAVGSYAKGEFAPTFDVAPFTIESFTGRLRLEYLF